MWIILCGTTTQRPLRKSAVFAVRWRVRRPLLIGSGWTRPVQSNVSQSRIRISCVHDTVKGTRVVRSTLMSERSKL